MAQQIPCDWCREVAADFMVTNIHNGDTIGLGVECVSSWAEALTSAMDQAAGYDNRAAANAAEAAYLEDHPELANPEEAASGPQEAAEPSDEEWEGDYPQGRPAGPEGAQEEPPADGGEDSEAGTASHVAG